MATPRFNWTQTEDELEICVHLPGLTKVNLESYCKVTDVFLGITFRRKILALDFLHPILPSNVKAMIKPPEITFTIKKATSRHWDDLFMDECKQVRLKRRKESIEKSMAEQAEYRKRRAEERRKRLKAAQKRMWDQESEIRETIEALEQESKASAQKALISWTALGSSGKELSTNKPPVKAEPSQSQRELTDSKTPKKKKKSKSLAKAMAKAFDPNGISKEKTYVTYVDEAPPKAPKTDPENLPPIRSFSTVGVNFTKAGVGPKREGAKEPPVFTKSQLPEGEVTPSTMTEKHPLYLRDKGIKHFHAGEFKGAENVFSEAHNIDKQNLQILLCLAETKRQIAFALRHEEEEKVVEPEDNNKRDVQYTAYFHLALSDVNAVLSNIPKPHRPEKSEHIVPAMVGVALRALLWNELGMSSTGIKKDTQTFIAIIQRVCQRAGGKEIKWGVWDNCFNQLTLEVQRLLLNLDE